jgi:hypothetical protein
MNQFLYHLNLEKNANNRLPKQLVDNLANQLFWQTSFNANADLWKKTIVCFHNPLSTDDDK